MKINNFQGELTDISAKKEPLRAPRFPGYRLSWETCECIFLQHYRMHMDIGNSKNYLGVPRILFIFVITPIYKKTCIRSNYPN